MKIQEDHKYAQAQRSARDLANSRIPLLESSNGQKQEPVIQQSASMQHMNPSINLPMSQNYTRAANFNFQNKINQ